MADYKRKKHRGFKPLPKSSKSRVKNKNEFEDIKMSSKGNTQKSDKMRVVKGKKLEQKRRFKIFSYVVCVLLISFLIMQIIMPAGLVETVYTSLSALGTGKYPIELESSDTINTVSKGWYYYVLTDKNLNAISNSGKVIYSYNHGFENPVLKTSQTRALLFDQGKTTALIFNSGGLKSQITVKEKIINAAIGENASYAFITNADNYAAAVKVYNKRDKLLYEWFSSEDLINNVAISKNGKKIAISTVTSAVGSYNSKVSILNYKSANAEYSKDFKNTIVYSLDSESRGFSVVTQNSYDYISWKGKNITQYSNDYSVDMVRNGEFGKVVVLNRESDKTDNRIVIFSKSGKIKNQMEFKGIITDISVKGSNVYCLSDTTVYILNTKGDVVRNTTCGFGVQKIAIIGQNKVAAVTDNLITEIKLK